MKEQEGEKGKVKSEDKTLVTTLNNHKVSNENLERKLEKEELSSTAVFKEF